MNELLQLPGKRHVSVWSSPGRGLWVASEGGQYRGMIERLGNGYVATDGLGHATGSFSSLDDAKESINSARVDLREVVLGA